jgi:malate synthase
MGGMAAQIPIKSDPQANETALRKVREDKEREASDGHDGTWVAHPGLVPIALEVFNAKMPGPNQRDRMREDVHVTAADLLTVPEGAITEQGLRVNVNVGLRYLESWLRGSGCVPIFNLMEDAATCEISRTQIWQWIKHPRGVLQDGRKVTRELYIAVLDEELEKIRADIGAEEYARGKFDLARRVFSEVATREPLVEFLTLPAYEHLP